MMRMALDGNSAMAYAMKQVNPDVVAAFPITPQTSLMQEFAEYVADGVVDTEMILVESEHSALSAVIGASAAGCRAMTATSSNGLALMWEIVYIAASLRMPVVMPVVNRALSGPINIHCDHSDSMGARDSGWIQIYSENPQEAYENLIMAVRIAEHPDVQLPVMVCQDGFITSHAVESVNLLDDAAVKRFAGEFQAKYPLLSTKRILTHGSFDLYDYFMEHKCQQSSGMVNARNAIREIEKEFSQITKKGYGMVQSHRTEDAKHIIVIMSSAAGTTRVAVDRLRKIGKKVGLVKIRFFRPFPAEEIRNALANAESVAVLDRSDSFNAVSGPLYTEVSAAMYHSKNRPKFFSYVFGLGGRDLELEHIEKVFSDLEKGEKQSAYNYLGVRG